MLDQFFLNCQRRMKQPNLNTRLVKETERRRKVQGAADWYAGTLLF
jgi:hypothetical protein